jgi:hypothetical protein
MTTPKSRLQLPDFTNWFFPLILILGILTSIIAFSADNQVDANIALVRQWLELTVSADISRGTPLLSETITVHESGKTVVMSPEQWIKKILERQQQYGKGSFHQMELFGQGDKVVAIYSLQRPKDPVSAVQIFKVVYSKIEEIWAQPIRSGVLWTWDANITGDKDTDANTRVFRRWYDEVYRNANWQLVPSVAGPTFIRHEDREFQMTSEEYSLRLKALFSFGARSIEYQVIAGADKVAVIAKQGPSEFVQAWRVRNGKLVESWWAGPTEADYNLQVPKATK